MKKTILLLCSFVALCFISCIKEDIKEQNPEENLVEVHFRATNDLTTKVGLNEDATKYVWNINDKVGIYDNATSKFNEFTVTEVYPDGSADIIGKLTEGYTAPFIAVYPYDASATLVTHNDKEAINIELKRDQTATAGSIPPESIFVTKSNDTNLIFKSVTGYVSFTVQSDNIKSVTLEDKNATTLVGKINVYTDNAGNAGPSEGSYFVSLTGDFQKGQTYYMAVRAGGFAKGLTLSLKDTEGNVYYKTSDKQPTNNAGANKLLKLGEISVNGLELMNDHNDRKLKWIHGVDFTFGTTTINKYTHPYQIRENGIKNDFVCFLSENTTTTASPSNSIIMNRYEGQKVELAKAGSPIYLTANDKENCVIISGVKLSVTNLSEKSNYFITNNGDYPLEQLTLDNVSVDLPQNTHLIHISGALRPINNLTINKCDIKLGVNTATTALFNVNAAVTNPIESFIFVDNILSSPANVDDASNVFNIFTTANNVQTAKIVFNKNTIVNVYPKGYFMTPGTLTTTEEAKNEINNNLFYFDYAIYKKVYTTINSENTPVISMLGIGNKLFSTENSSFSKNYVIYANVDAEDGKDGIPNKRMKMANNINDGNVSGGIYNKTTANQEVFDLDDPTKFNIADGIFVNKSKVYGAQR